MSTITITSPDRKKETTLRAEMLLGYEARLQGDGTYNVTLLDPRRKASFIFTGVTSADMEQIKEAFRRVSDAA